MTYRIGSAQGFYGDDVTRALPMIEGGHVDVVCFEALSELTLAILQKDKLANPQRGYTFDVRDHRGSRFCRKHSRAKSRLSPMAAD